MTINILDIPDQRFYMWDKKMEEGIKASLDITGGLRTSDSEEARTELKSLMSDIFGFRLAEKLANSDVEKVEEELRREQQRQRGLRSDLRKALTTPILGADLTGVVKRSGLGRITERLQGEVNWTEIYKDFAEGKPPTAHLSEPVIEILGLLPYVLLSRDYREGLESRLILHGLNEDGLREVFDSLPKPLDIDLPEYQRFWVENQLLRCLEEETIVVDLEGGNFSSEDRLAVANELKRVQRSSHLKLAASLKALGSGDAKKLFGRDYRNHRNNIHTNLLEGGALSSDMARSLGVREVSRWSAMGPGTHVLNPKMDTDAETLGLYIGHFCFVANKWKSARVTRYPARRISEGGLSDLLEMVGKLSKKPIMSVIGGSGKEFYSYTIPKQFTNLAKYGLETSRRNDCGWTEDFRSAVYRNALAALMQANRLEKHKDFRIAIRKDIETDVRRMAQSIGLNLTQGEYRENTLSLSISNPEIVLGEYEMETRVVEIAGEIEIDQEPMDPVSIDMVDQMPAENKYRQSPHRRKKIKERKPSTAVRSEGQVYYAKCEVTDTRIVVGYDVDGGRNYRDFADKRAAQSFIFELDARGSQYEVFERKYVTVKKSVVWG